MKAKQEQVFDKDRVVLHEAIPLATPFSITLEPVSYCNLACKFCCAHVFHESYGGLAGVQMSSNVFEKILEQTKDFPSPIKAVRFVGFGEPLLHDDIPNMVSKLKESGNVEKVAIITNGTLLTPELSLKLIEAGLDEIKISVNGLTAEDYEKTCGVPIDMDEYLRNIEYLYKNKKQLTVGIKILDSSLRGKSEDAFYALFSDYCDVINIEHEVPVADILNGHVESVDRPMISDMDKMQSVCASVFYALSVSSTGKIFPCAAWFFKSQEESLVTDTTLYAFWNSALRKQLMLNTLEGKFDTPSESCKTCDFRIAIKMFASDNLDEHASEILKRCRKSWMVEQ